LKWDFLRGGESGEVALGDDVAMPDESFGELPSELEKNFELAEDTPLELQPSEMAPVSMPAVLSDNDGFKDVSVLSWVGDLERLLAVEVRWFWC